MNDIRPYPKEMPWADNSRDVQTARRGGIHAPMREPPEDICYENRDENRF